MTYEEIAKLLKEHAQKHYGEDGWDYVIECFDDNELVEYLKEEKYDTIEKAIKEVGRTYKRIAEIHAERESGYDH